MPASSPKTLALLIPGLDGTGRLFEPHLEAISRRYRPIPWCFDRRDCFGLEDLVLELGEATRAEPPGSITVAAESFGGPIAMLYVLTYPDRVRSLVLVNTFCYYHRRIRIGLACRLAPLLSWGILRGIKNAAASGLLALEGVGADGRRLYQEVVDSVHLPSYCRRLDLVRRIDLRPRLGEIRTPTRILAAGRDKIVPSLYQARVLEQGISGARVHEFPRAGHALLITPGFSLAAYL